MMLTASHVLAAWSPEQWQAFLPAMSSFLGSVTQAVFLPVAAALLGHQYGVSKANKERLDRQGADLNALKGVPVAEPKMPPINEALVDTLPLGTPAKK